jgi:hypothetical protein
MLYLFRISQVLSVAHAVSFGRLLTSCNVNLRIIVKAAINNVPVPFCCVYVSLMKI